MARTKEGCERERIKKDIREQFGIPEDNMNSVIVSLVDELYWQIIKLREVKKQIDEEGITTNFVQGKQDMVIQNAALKSYNDLIKNQSVTIKNLLALLGKKATGNEDNALLEFITKGKQRRVVS